MLIHYLSTALKIWTYNVYYIFYICEVKLNKFKLSTFHFYLTVLFQSHGSYLYVKYEFHQTL